MTRSCCVINIVKFELILLLHPIQYVWAVHYVDLNKVHTLGKYTLDYVIINPIAINAYTEIRQNGLISSWASCSVDFLYF